MSSPSGDVRGRGGGRRGRRRAGARRGRRSSARRARRPTTRPTSSLRLTRDGRAARCCCVGHLDTVIGHDDHQPLRREDDRLVGSGTIDMKGGDVLALGRPAGARRAPRRSSPRSRSCSSATRSGASGRSPTSSASPATTRACASRPARRRPTAATRSSSAARRRARCTSRATGRSAHSGSAPDAGVNALLALAGGGPGRRRLPRPGRPRAADRRADGPALRGGVQRRPGRRRARLRRARRLAARPSPRPGRGPGRGRRRAPARPRSLREWPGHGRARGDRRTLLERASAAIGRPVAGGRAGRRQRREPLRRVDPVDRRRPRAAGRRRARAARARRRRVAGARAPRSRWPWPTPCCRAPARADAPPFTEQETGVIPRRRQRCRAQVGAVTNSADSRYYPAVSYQPSRR